jgi:hypothetical protein
MSDVERQIEALAARVQALEDELAISRLLIRCGFTVDTDDVEAMLALFAPEARITIDGSWTLEGHDDARQIVEGPTHRSYLPFCAHNLGPFVIEVDRDTAVATGYSRVYLRTEHGFKVERVSANWWRLERREHGWTIVERDTAIVGAGDVTFDVVRRGL